MLSLVGLLQLFYTLSMQPQTNWYSKRQATEENTTYRSEFVAAKSPTEQIIELRQTLWYLGVPIKSKTFMFGDNKSVVTTSNNPSFPIEQKIPFYPIIRFMKQLQQKYLHSIGVTHLKRYWLF